ncbi:MAG: hypothetical protein K8S25_06085 [Alphaproteobacteria bacterium]|nr:hypothetical protein [Alphaproteobacteria bacterium]
MALLSLASALAMHGLAGCARATAKLRYRLKIVVRVDGTVHTGSSVIEAQFLDFGQSMFRAPEAGRFATKSWGEAVAIDLKDRGFLFGLLERPLVSTEGFQVGHLLDVLAKFPENQRRLPDSLLSHVGSLQGEFELREPDRPILVRFRDIRDPSTVELVDARRISAHYGDRAALMEVTISVTQDPVTTGLDERLPWLESAELAKPGRTFAGKLPPGPRPASQMSLPAQLTIHNFRRNGD